MTEEELYRQWNKDLAEAVLLALDGHADEVVEPHDPQVLHGLNELHGQLGDRDVVLKWDY